MNSSLKTHIKILSNFYDQPFIVLDSFIDPLEIELTFLDDLGSDEAVYWPYKDYKWRGKLLVTPHHFPIVEGSHYLYATKPQKIIRVAMELMNAVLKSGDIGVYQPLREEIEPQLFPATVYLPRYSLN